MLEKLREILKTFSSDNGFDGNKGPLCVALIVTQHARDMGLPLEPDVLRTEGGGQVLGLGKSAVQIVLNRHGIGRVLAAEGGRTSRGSLKNMKVYVDLLNRLHTEKIADLDAVENYWIERVQDFFAAKPFKLTLDATRGLRSVVRHLLDQAVKRQATAPGTHYAGAVLQHLVGAKLDCALGRNSLEHNSFSTADAHKNRPGDFLVGDVAIHVTTFPGEAVIERCRQNIDSGLKPVVVTVHARVAVAQEIADQGSLGDRIDIFEIEQFVALNLYEHGRFMADGRLTAMTDLVKRYNEIVTSKETDPSLRIIFG